VCGCDFPGNCNSHFFLTPKGGHDIGRI
jgi:hypothetical protein